MMDILMGPIGVAFIIVLVLLLIMGGVFSMWKKVPQDKALVVTGLKKRVISGGGGFVVPMLERADIISLENMQIDVAVKGLTSAGVEINVNALTILKIKNAQNQILAAMEQFNTGKLESTIANIKKTATEVLEGKLREILAKMSVEEVYKDREKFASSVQDVASKELEDMGLEIKAFTIKEISDPSGYLSSLGKKRVAEVKKDAAIAESNAKKEQEITIAENERQISINIANAKKETEIQLAKTLQEEKQAKLLVDIEIANATREKELRVLENQKRIQTEQANSDSAYEIQRNNVQKQVIETEMAAKLIQEAKNVELVTAQMAVDLKEKEKETAIAKQEALRMQEELVASIQKTAEAESAKIKTMADATLYKTEKDSEAAKVQAIKKAEAESEQKRLAAVAESEAKKVQAEADAYATQQQGISSAKSVEVQGLAKATAIEAEGLAEAKVIREKGLADAEAMQKKAEAYKEYGQAAITEMVVKVLPEITSSVSNAVAESMTKIGNITIIDSGSDSKGANKVTEYATKMLTEMPEIVKATTGVDMLGLLKNVTENISKKD